MMISIKRYLSYIYMMYVSNNIYTVYIYLSLASRGGRKCEEEVRALLGNDRRWEQLCHGSKEIPIDVA